MANKPVINRSLTVAALMAFSSAASAGVNIEIEPSRVDADARKTLSNLLEKRETTQMLLGSTTVFSGKLIRGGEPVDLSPLRVATHYDSTNSVIDCYNNCHSACHSACHGSRGWR